jgi:hypothetical protein
MTQALVSKRRAQAIALRMAGMDYATIAERLDYASPQAASKDLYRAMRSYREEEESKVEEWRQLESQRLDRLQAAAWGKALKGDLKAIETVLKVISQRSKLLGLDMPLRAEVSGPNGGAVPVGPVGIAQLRELIRTAGDPDPEADGDLDDAGSEDTEDDSVGS